MSRILPFDGVHNFRDFGDYAGADGRRMAKGRFFRSANHARASDADLQRLAALNIAAIVDLRRPAERARDPSKRWEQFSAAVVDNHDDFEGHEPWENFIRASDLTADSFRSYNLRFYADAPYMPRHLDLYARYFTMLAEADGAVLVHCTAGKDRTGLIVALTHALAGVHRDDIFADYLLTNDSDRVAKFGPLWAANLERELGRRPTLDALAVAMSVEADYLHAALTAIEQRHGALETYLREALGVDARKRDAIEKRLFG
ncbi:MAG: tyrosine-protein phosphatase [Hyphomonadaceae bacterium]